MKTVNHKGVKIQIVSEIADVAMATMYTDVVSIINGAIVTIPEPRLIKGTLKHVKNEIVRYLKNDWARVAA